MTNEEALKRYKQALQNFDEADYDFIVPAIYQLKTAEAIIGSLVIERRNIINV